MGFAPLFEEERRQKMKMLKQVVKIMKNKEQINRPRKFYRDIFIIYFVKVLCKFWEIKDLLSYISPIRYLGEDKTAEKNCTNLFSYSDISS